MQGLRELQWLRFRDMVQSIHEVKDWGDKHITESKTG